MFISFIQDSSPKFRQQSVKFFKESGLAFIEAAKRLSLPKRTLKNWIYADKKGELVALGKNQKPLSELELELSRVKRELAEVRMERERENARLGIEIKAAHQRTRETYSAKRLHSDLVDHGVQAIQCRVRTLRKKLGLRCKQKRKFKVTTDSKHHLPIAPNILQREFAVSAPNKAWVSDITYISTDEGWLYLAGIKELFNGELVGYSMSERMTKDLVIQALFRATAKKRLPIGLILHSDRGSQYCAHDYQKSIETVRHDRLYEPQG